MSMKKNLNVSILLVIMFLVSGVFFSIKGIDKATANPSYFPVSSNCVLGGSGTPTTSPTYITAGTATSTLNCDAYTLASNNINPLAMDSAVLLMNFTGSSTASIVNINFEYSNDNIDWYQDGFSASATTSSVVSIGTTRSLSWTFASSTAGLGNTLGNSTTTKAVPVPVPTRYVRAIFTMPAGSAAGAVWAQIIPKKEVNN